MFSCNLSPALLAEWPGFATVVTRGWNGYRNKGQHRKSTLEKKILPPFQQGFEPATFQSRVRRSNHWAIPAPPRVSAAQLSCTYLDREKKSSGHSCVTVSSRTSISVVVNACVFLSVCDVCAQSTCCWIWLLPLLFFLPLQLLQVSKQPLNLTHLWQWERFPQEIPPRFVFVS